MPETVLGLPLHPLIVHGAVVLVPIAAALAIVIAINQERRERWGLLTWLFATAALGATFGARLSGQNLSDDLFPGAPPVPVAEHGDYGSSSIWFVLALWLAVSAVLLLDIDRRRRDDFGSALLPTVLAVAVIVAAMAATGQILLTGWTGSEAHWEPRVPNAMARS